MKRILVLLVVLLLGVYAWHGRRTLFRFYWSMRNPPPKIHFTDARRGRIHIEYAKSPFLESRIAQLAEDAESNLEEAEKFTGANLTELTIRIYNTFEEKGADTEDIRIAHADAGDSTIYCIVNDTMDGTKERLEYEVLLHRCCGNPASPDVGRAAVAALAGVWNQKKLSEWNEFLRTRGLDLPQGDPAGVSEFIRIPRTALDMREVLDRQGREAFLRFYRNAARPAEAPPPERTDTDPVGQDPAPFRPVFQKGVSYAYENGYSGGYPTRKSAASLDLLRKNGVEWIASIPYGFMRAADAVKIGSAGHSIFTESDESLFALAADAKARGMKVMLKPQIWLHRGWPGMVDFPDQASWNSWFESYENWIVHYAIIAELTEADLFCIGTEFSKATVKQPDQWRRLIHRIRKVYHGPLTYAANYGQEFEQLQFWDALDYMGLDNYYPVRSSTDDGIDAMKEGFAKQKERLREIVHRWNRPLIFTEIGYHANPGAGMGSREDEISGYDETMQAACYRLAMETYWNEPWFYGMYWWKWFSDPDDRGRNADEHSPHGRLAERALAEWYRDTTSPR